MEAQLLPPASQQAPPASQPAPFTSGSLAGSTSSERPHPSSSVPGVIATPMPDSTQQASQQPAQIPGQLHQFASQQPPHFTTQQPPQAPLFPGQQFPGQQYPGQLYPGQLYPQFNSQLHPQFALTGQQLPHFPGGQFSSQFAGQQPQVIPPGSMTQHLPSPFPFAGSHIAKPTSYASNSTYAAAQAQATANARINGSLASAIAPHAGGRVPSALQTLMPPIAGADNLTEQQEVSLGLFIRHWSYENLDSWRALRPVYKRPIPFGGKSFPGFL
jgi:hypothetical protein